MNEKQNTILTKVMAIINEKVSPEDDWGWDSWGELSYYGPDLALNMTPAEVNQFATHTCLPDLWALRAYGARIGIPVPTTDWWFYNERPEAVMNSHRAWGLKKRAKVGYCGSGFKVHTHCPECGKGVEGEWFPSKRGIPGVIRSWCFCTGNRHIDSPDQRR